MTKHERRMEELLHVISDELSELEFYAEKRDSGSRANANSRTRCRRDTVNSLRSAMYDELNEPSWFKRFLRIFKRKEKSK